MFFSVLFRNRKGMELSINFIVMLILALAVFSGGLVFASKFFGHAEKVKGTLDAQTERQIEKLLDSGSPVVIPINTKEIFRNKHATFGIGVLAQFNGKYEVNAELLSAVEKGTKSPLQNVDAMSWLSGVPATQDLKKNDKGKFLILVNVPRDVKSGTYIFKVFVKFHSSTDSPPVPDMAYDTPVQMIVQVP